MVAPPIASIIPAMNLRTTEAGTTTPTQFHTAQLILYQCSPLQRTLMACHMAGLTTALAILVRRPNVGIGIYTRPITLLADAISYANVLCRWQRAACTPSCWLRMAACTRAA